MAIERVEGFDALYRRFERKMSTAGRSKSTITNYGRHIVAIALHFRCLPAKRHSDSSIKARRKRNGRLFRQRHWDGRLIAVHAASNSPWCACTTSVETTLVYLHVQQNGRQVPFSPLDRIYQVN